MEILKVFVLAVLLFGICIIAALGVSKSKYSGKNRSLYLVFAGVALAAFVMFFPIYQKECAVFPHNEFFAALLSFHNTLRLFVLDGEFSFVKDFLAENYTDYATDIVIRIYSGFFALLFASAPVLTFSIVLSFFKNILAYIRYWFNYRKEVFVFSELNDKSLALATDLKKNDKKRLIIFCGALQDADSPDYLLGDNARELNAIVFKKEIVEIPFEQHKRNRSISFFCIREDEDKNINEGVELIDRYNGRINTKLYVFSSGIDGELVLGAIDKGNVKVKRVNEVQSLIDNLLYETGIEIFESANPVGDDGFRKITGIVVGLGKHGMAMAKSLPWFCQMTGYRLEMHVFDRAPDRFSKLVAECPELLDAEHIIKAPTEQDAFYSVYGHSDCDVHTSEFNATLMNITDATYVFVSLGSDEENLRTAVKLRTIFEKMGIKPIIKTVIYDSDKCNSLRGIKNHSSQLYDINFVGDLRTSFSESVILNSEVESVALDRHLKWGDEASFWDFEYNYKSSVASAIHRKLKLLCAVPGVDKSPTERTIEERDGLRRLEHRRWNAYMRANGFTYSEKRNNLAKTHHCLVNYDELSEEDKAKDDD